MPVPSQVITVFTVCRLLTDFVCLYNYEFWLSLCKIVQSLVILLLPIVVKAVTWGNNEEYLRYFKNQTPNYWYRKHNINQETNLITIYLLVGKINNFSTKISQKEFNLLQEHLNRNESGRFGALKSDSTDHFFRNACTKSGSLRFSQFSGCWLILSVYIINENASLIIFSAETEYISTRYWYRNINFLRDRIRRIFL
jgi:hypothetical protein